MAGEGLGAGPRGCALRAGGGCWAGVLGETGEVAVPCESVEEDPGGPCESLEGHPWGFPAVVDLEEAAFLYI